MASQGFRQLRATTNRVLDAFLQAARERGGGHAFSLDELTALVEQLQLRPDLDAFYKRAYHDISTQIVEEVMERNRANPFNRVVVHPLGGCFQDGTLSREILPNLFSFLHMVLGDEVETMAAACTAAMAELQEDLGDEFDWKAVYQHPRCKAVLWQVLGHVAASFPRFELRKDWFIKFMQYNPKAMSLSSNAFVEREAHDELHFSEDHFYILFHHWFDPVRTLDAEAEAAFVAVMGKPSHEVYGAVFVNLAKRGH